MLRLKVSLLFLGAIMYASGQTTCGTNCTTTIVILDCSGAVVSGAHVRIKVCCDGSEEEHTSDKNGQVTFPHCLKDICESRVTLRATTQALDRGNCSGSGGQNTCVIKICSGDPQAEQKNSNPQLGLGFHGPDSVMPRR